MINQFDVTRAAPGAVIRYRDSRWSSVEPDGYWRITGPVERRQNGETAIVGRPCGDHGYERRSSGAPTIFSATCTFFAA